MIDRGIGTRSTFDGYGRRVPNWAIFVGALIVLILTMDRQIALYDEGLMLTAASRMHAGDMLHRDFYFVYGPASPWLLTKLWAISPATFLVARAYGLIIQAGIVATCHHLLRPRVSTPVTIAFCIAILLWFVGMQSQLYPSFPGILIALVSAGLLLSRDSSPPPPARLILAGSCAGLASMFRYDVGIPIIMAQAGYMTLLGLHGRAERVDFPTIIRQVGLLFVGFVAVTGPAALAYWRAGLFDAWWQDIITSATSYYVSHRNLPFPSVLRVVRRPSLAGAYLPIAAVVIGAIVFATPIPGDRPATTDQHDRKRFGLLMGALASCLYYKGVVRAEPVHFIMSIVPAMLLMALCVDALWSRSARMRYAVATIMLIVLLPPLHAASSAIGRTVWDPGRPMARWLLAGGWRGMPQGVSGLCGQDPRLLGAWLPHDEAVATAFVRARTGAGERVFVTTAHADRFTMNAVALYFAMDRQPGTHWHIFDPGLQTRSDIQQAIIRDLTGNDVRWIVRDAFDDRLREPNRSSISSGIRILDRWIAHQYRMVGNAGPVSVWLRRGIDIPAPRSGGGCD